MKTSKRDLLYFVVTMCVFIGLWLLTSTPVPTKAQAFTYATPKFYFHTNMFDTRMTNPYVVVCRKSDWYVADKTTGTPGVAEAYAANAYTVGAGVVLHSISGGCVATFGPLDGSVEWCIIVGDNASPALTDDIKVFEYDPSTNRALDEMTPINKGRWMVK